MQTTRDCSSFLQSMKEDLVKYLKNVRFVNGPEYLRRNKLLALGYFKIKEEIDAIFHLTESHGATLRQKAIYTFDQKDTSNHDMKIFGDLLYELPSDCITFSDEYIQKGPSGLLDCLQDMPQEWTIVQLTLSFDFKEPVLGYTNTRVPEMLNLHLTRLPCGSLVKEKKPCTVMIQPPENDPNDGLRTILEVIHQSLNKLTSKTLISKKEKLKRRKEASDDIKGVISREVISTWLKEWCCLMIGTLCDDFLNKIVKSTVDSIISSLCKNKQFKITETKLSILYQIVDGCAHLDENSISRAVEYCVGSDDEICHEFISRIIKFKEKYSHSLMTAKRNPVLLILDDNLEVIPWELLPIFYKHPVSRVPSIHFTYAIYEKHKENIVNGKRIVKNTDTAFYIINPSGDLQLTERNLIKFIEQRHPNWNGLKGEIPNGDIFVRSLLDYNVFMYSGHGDGTQYLNPEAVCRLNVDVVPLLFGCSSASKRHFGQGGKNEMMGFSEQLLIAGCPCLIGMLWPVTTVDTDLVTIMLLNMTMSGDPVDVNEVIGSEEIEAEDGFIKEPELLRALKSARSAAKLYTNGAALVARGIPVEFHE